MGKGPSAFRGLLVRLAVLTCGLLAGLLAAELGVRLVGLAPRMIESLYLDNYRLSGNPVLKYEYRPDYSPEDSAYDELHKGFATNGAGFRDRSHALAKPRDTVRIICLGDSTTAGNGVSDARKTYPRVLQRLWNDAGAEPRVEVFNMGVGGYHTLQQAETLRAKGLQYDPDVVTVGFCINDFSWNSDGNVYVRLLKRLDEGERGALRGLQTHREGVAGALLKHSHLARFTYVRLCAARAPEEPGPQDTEEAANDPVTAGLALLSRLQQEHGFLWVIYIIPGLDAPFAEYKYGDIHEHLKAAAGPYPNLHVVDLTADMRHASEDGNLLSMDGIHPNEKGHAVIADAVCRDLMARLDPR